MKYGGESTKTIEKRDTKRERPKGDRKSVSLKKTKSPMVIKLKSNDIHARGKNPKG